jgi:hypothetical protein
MNSGLFRLDASAFVILRYSEGALVIRAVDERSFGVPQDDKSDGVSGSSIN